MFYIGIDGGGTKSEFVLLNEKEHVINSVLSGPTNVNSHGREAVFRSLEHGFKMLLNKYEIVRSEINVCLASAGVDRPSDKTVYEMMLNELGFEKYTVRNDAEAALSAGTHGEDGIIVIAGTGSIVMAVKDNHIIRAGGWGHLLGDEGSGYDIAISGIKSVIQAYDGYGDSTILEQTLIEAIDGNDATNFIDFIYQENFSKDQIAKLSSEVDRCANAGDVVSKNIIEKSASDLSLQVLSIVKHHFKNVQRIPIILNGSVAKKSRVYKSKMESILSRNGNIECRLLETSAAIGAAYLARRIGD